MSEAIVQKIYEEVVALRQQVETLQQELSKVKAASPKSPKKAKAPKDPNAPKNGRNGYILYQMDRRPSLKEEQPELKPQELMSVMAAEWKALKAANGDEYKHWQAEQETDKERAKREKAAYEAQKAQAQ